MPRIETAVLNIISWEVTIRIGREKKIRSRHPTAVDIANHFTPLIVRKFIKTLHIFASSILLYSRVMPAVTLVNVIDRSSTFS